MGSRGLRSKMTRITATKGDITTMAVDAVVNAANSELAGGGGVDGAIHRAGGATILQECEAWVAVNGLLAPGEAMVTTAGEMPARIVIHTVGPIWSDHDERTARRLLASCYTDSLDLAVEHRCGSVAFPNISTGVYGFPKEPAAETAVNAVSEWVGAGSELDQIVFVCFNVDNLAIYSRLLES